MSPASVHDTLTDLYSRPGPFTTVYLDADRTTENGAHEVELRWREVRERLAEQADAADLDAIGAAIDADLHTGGRHGLLVVATAGEVVFSDVLRDPPATSSGSVDPLPRLFPWAAQRAENVPHIVVVADTAGADLLYVDERGGEHTEEVEGSAQFPRHRTGADQWDVRHFELRVENNWETNAHDVAEAVGKLVAAHAVRLVVVAGEVRGRSLTLGAVKDLVPPHVTVAEVEEGGRAAGSSDEALEQAVRTQVVHELGRRRNEVLDRLRENLGRGEYAAQGSRPVVDALRASQVDTVVVSDDPSSTLRVWIGPNPTDLGFDDEEAAATGVQDVAHDRFDSALVRAVHGTGAHLLVVPGPHAIADEGIGALLRY